RRVDADEDELRRGGRFGCVERERQPVRVPLQQLAQARLEERRLARPQLLDPLRDDVANRHLVPELGEAGPGDEADPAGAEDRDRLIALPAHKRHLTGRSPRAISIIVSRESASSSVFTNQELAPYSFRKPRGR